MISLILNERLHVDFRGLPENLSRREEAERITLTGTLLRSTFGGRGPAFRLEQLNYIWSRNLDARERAMGSSEIRLVRHIYKSLN